MIPIRDSTPRRGFPIVTLALIALNAYVFWIQLQLPKRNAGAFVEAFGLIPARFTQWSELGGSPIDPLRLLPFLSSMFLHGGWLHFLGNMLYLWIFGDNVEDRLGKLRFLAFYLLSGACAAAAQVWAMPDSAVPTIGASGAIAGVLGAYFVTYPRARIVTLVPLIFIPWFVEIPALVFLGIWFAMQFFMGWAQLSGAAPQGGVAFWEHAGGFVAGAILMLLMRPHAPARRFA